MLVYAVTLCGERDKAGNTQLSSLSAAAKKAGGPRSESLVIVRAVADWLAVGR